MSDHPIPSEQQQEQAAGQAQRPAAHSSACRTIEGYILRLQALEVPAFHVASKVVPAHGLHKARGEGRQRVSKGMAAVRDRKTNRNRWPQPQEVVQPPIASTTMSSCTVPPSLRPADKQRRR